MAAATAIAKIRFLDNTMAVRRQGYLELISADKSRLNVDDPELLSGVDMNLEDMHKIEVAESFKTTVAQDTFSIKEAYDLRQQLITDALASIGEYRGEVLSIAENEQRVTARKKDYGSVLHSWVYKLAKKGVLEDVIKTAS